MGTAPDSLVFRTDASSKIGMGHFMRCFALAQAWSEMGGRAIFAMNEISPATEAHRQSIAAEAVQLTAPFASLEEGRETAAVAARAGARWIVADGYEFAPGYQQALRNEGSRVLLIDDDGRYQRYETDLVLNQNIYAAESLYANRTDRTRLLLGPRYALLRGQFRLNPPPLPAKPSVARKVLVTLGGADPANATLTVIEALRLLSGDAVEAVVVVGGNNPHGANLERTVASLRHDVRLIHDAKNMPELMVWADVAISAAGSTTLELAYMGVPMLLLILADNQQAVAEGMQAAGVARNLGWAQAASAGKIAAALQKLITDVDQQEQMSKAARTLVDGQGASRVAQTLREEPMHLRPATPNDARLLFNWTNDPEVRAVSFNSAPISWMDHERWFHGKLANPRAVLLIAQNDRNEPLGVARFEVTGGVATISISIAASSRGRGCGKQLIELASESVSNRPDVTAIRALVKPDNLASVRAFVAAGYREESAGEPNGARVFMLDRSMS